ncbi:hypothetical protein F2P81_001745 [Scophthalmus maximus]|uniref:Uncharacterized protein n=1 Tax=Scophthalmus maximus TaxID=52904 RepID=A0A6A4TC76_SCOMX|nr:hypothetical protein F2P81_001745 [Scophthalmus maximus]
MCPRFSRRISCRLHQRELQGFWRKDRIRTEEKNNPAKVLSQSCRSTAHAHRLSGRGSTVKLSVRRQQPIVGTGAPPRAVMRQRGGRCDVRSGVAGGGGGGGGGSGVGPEELMSRRRQLGGSDP